MEKQKDFPIFLISRSIRILACSERKSDMNGNDCYDRTTFHLPGFHLLVWKVTYRTLITVVIRWGNLSESPYVKKQNGMWQELEVMRDIWTNFSSLSRVELKFNKVPAWKIWNVVHTVNTGPSLFYSFKYFKLREIFPLILLNQKVNTNDSVYYFNDLYTQFFHCKK